MSDLDDIMAAGKGFFSHRQEADARAEKRAVAEKRIGEAEQWHHETGADEYRGLTPVQVREAVKAYNTVPVQQPSWNRTGLSVLSSPREDAETPQQTPAPVFREAFHRSTLAQKDPGVNLPYEESDYPEAAKRR